MRVVFAALRLTLAFRSARARAGAGLPRLRDQRKGQFDQRDRQRHPESDPDGAGRTAARAAITISPDGKLLYVCASDENGVEVFDTETMKIVRTLQSGPDPEQFALNASGNPLYIANENNAQVTVLDRGQEPGSRAPCRSASSRKAWRISPDGKLLVATSETTNMAHFIDAHDLQAARQRAGRTKGRATPCSARMAPASG